jgi:hypothetical protein
MCRSRFLQLAVVITSLGLSPSLAGANSTTVNYTDSGAYNEFAGGFHSAANQTYIAGLCPQVTARWRICPSGTSLCSI